MMAKTVLDLLHSLGVAEIGHRFAKIPIFPFSHPDFLVKRWQLVRYRNFAMGKWENRKINPFHVS